MTVSRRVIALLTGLLLPLSSCFWGNENSEENVVGNFWLKMKADEHDYHLYYDNQGEFGSPLIRSRVAAAGHNDRVIIIKSCIGYYIIPLKSIQDQEIKIAAEHYVKVDVQSNIIGPFTKAVFNQELVALGEDSLMRFDQQLADCQ